MRMVLNNLELMNIHLETLFRHDQDSSLIGINDWRGGEAPRMFLGRTEQGSVCRFRSDLPKVTCRELAELCHKEPYVLDSAPVYLEAYREILAGLSPVNAIWNGPAYCFLKSPGSPANTIRIGLANGSLLENGLVDWAPDIPYQQPMVAIIEDGLAIAICASVRIGRNAHEAGVEVLEPYRNRGYANAVVSAWAQAVYEQGALPMYSTSAENIASQNLAAKLGLGRYGSDFHIT